MNSARMMVETDLRVAVEGDFASVDALGVGRITLTSPDGIRYPALKGIIYYDYVRTTPEGETVIVHEPVVVMRISTLSRVPKADENWSITMPTGPQPTAPLRTFALVATRAPTSGDTIGFIKLYPQAAVQS